MGNRSSVDRRFGSLVARHWSGKICAGTGLAPHATSAPGLGSPPCHLCTGTGLIPPTSAPGLGSPLSHLRRDWAHPARSAPGLMARVQAPVEKELQWDEDGIRGQSRFLQRLWGLAAHASGTARRGHSASRSKIVEVRLASWHDTFRNVAQPWWQPQRSFAFLRCGDAAADTVPLAWVQNFCFSLSLSLSHTHTLSLSHSHTHTLSLSLTLSLTLSLSLPARPPVRPTLRLPVWHVPRVSRATCVVVEASQPSCA